MTRCRLRKLPLRSAVPSSPMRFTEAGGVNIVDQDLLGCRLAPSDSPVATALCFHQGAIWGGMISPLLVLYATAHQITLAGPILVTTVVGVAIFLVAVLLSPETKGKFFLAS